MSRAGVLPQAAEWLDTSPELGPDEVRIDVARLNFDVVSFRQLFEKHGGDGDATRAEVLDIVRTRSKMHNPVTGPGGMLTCTVAELGAHLNISLQAANQVTTLVSLTLTPLVNTDATT